MLSAQTLTRANLTPSTPTMSVSALSGPPATLTQQGSIVGTSQFMAPEVLQGQEADARSDIFSFGCVLYEMLAGRRAFEGKSQISVASAILEKEPEPITKMMPAAPPALDHVVQECLAKNPEARWQNAGDVARELRWIEQRFRGRQRAAGPRSPRLARASAVGGGDSGAAGGVAVVEPAGARAGTHDAVVLASARRDGF
jgi:serine/threonine protein kinase